MRLFDMLKTLRTIDYERIEIRDYNGYEMFTCPAKSDTLIPYMNYIVTEWFPRGAPDKNVTFTVYIREVNNEQ